MAGMKGQKKRVWSDEGKLSICTQARVSGVSVAQVARRYAMNTKLRRHRTFVDAPMNASTFFGTIGHVIRCSLVSGLKVAAFQTPRAHMEICGLGPVRIPVLDGTSSGIMGIPTWSHDRLPLRSSVLLTFAATPRRA